MKKLKLFLFILSISFVTSVSAQSVYTTKTGEKYHKENCKYLKYSKKEITLQKALELGYSPCSVCKPSTEINTSQKSSNLSSSTNNSPSTTKATATQCTAKTQSGNRCKRMTKNVNGRCYQH